MFTFKIFVKNNSLNSVTLRITNNRKSAILGLDCSMLPDTFDMVKSGVQKRELLAERTKYNFWMKSIDEIQLELEESGRSGEDVAVIKRMLAERMMISPRIRRRKIDIVKENKKNERTFEGWFERFINGKSRQGTKIVYQHTLNRLRAFCPDLSQLKFEDIDFAWLSDFEAFCAQTATKNARNIHLRNIRAVFNNAIDHEITDHYPFRRYKIRPEATRKRAMPVDELRRLFNYPVEEYAELYRDMFKLMFMLIGINTVDLHALKKITRDGRIEYKRAKTGRLYSIKVEPEAREIIEKYRGKTGLLCIADRWRDSRNFGHQCNKALQRIGMFTRRGRGGKKIVESEWPELTTYWTRHSWATIARRLGVSKDDIALALGHADDAHSTTNIYIDEDISVVDVANRKVIDYVLYDKTE